MSSFLAQQQVIYRMVQEEGHHIVYLFIFLCGEEDGLRVTDKDFPQEVGLGEGEGGGSQSM